MHQFVLTHCTNVLYTHCTLHPVSWPNPRFCSRYMHLTCKTYNVKFIPCFWPPGGPREAMDTSDLNHWWVSCQIYINPQVKVASFPGPAQLSIACSMVKWEEPGIFSRVSMTQSVKGKNLPNEQAAFRIFSTDYTLNTRCVRQSPPASYVRVVSYLVLWLFLLFWAQCTHTQLKYWKWRKAGWGLGMRLLHGGIMHSHVLKACQSHIKQNSKHSSIIKFGY